jgi:hypothetical protein
MGYLAAAIGLLAAGVGGHRAARAGLGLPSVFPAALGGFVLAWVWLSLGTLGLGLTGWLGRWPLVGWSLAGLIVAFLATRGQSPSPRDDHDQEGAGWGIDVALALGLALWTVLIHLITSLILPVKVISDGPIYHLYFAARWWQAGRIFLVPTPFGETAAPYFPAFGDMWLTWLFVVFGGDRLARVGQIPFLAVSAVTIYVLARRLRANPSAAAVAATWFATISPLIVYSAEPIVDTIFLTGYLLAFFFAARYALGDGGPTLLAVAGLAAGSAWGTKAPGIVFIPPLLVAIVGVALAQPNPWRKRLWDAAVVLGTASLPEVYWLARNAWLTGNPIYPLHIQLFGRVLFPGWYGPDAMPKSRYYIDFHDWAAGLDILLAILDPRLAPIWLAALAGAWRLGRLRVREDRMVWVCSGFAVFNIALYWIFIPYRTQMRFFLHAMGLSTVPLARLFDRSRWLRALGVLLLFIHVATPQDWPFSLLGRTPPWDLSPLITSSAPSPIPFASDLDAILHPTRQVGILAGLALFLVGAVCVVTGGLMGLARRDAPTRWVAPALGLVAAGLIQARVIVTHETDARIYRFPPFNDYFAGWVDLDARIGRFPARIAYAGTNLPYYLMGKDFANDVRYINVDAHRDWLLHDYHHHAGSPGTHPVWPDTRPGWDRLAPDYAAWLANLEAARIGFLVVNRADPLEGLFNCHDAERYPIERAWADAHPERFTLLHAEPLFRTYAVRPPRK